MRHEAPMCRAWIVSLLNDERSTCSRSMIARMVPRASLSSSVGATLGTNLRAAALVGPWPPLSQPGSHRKVQHSPILFGWLPARSVVRRGDTQFIDNASIDVLVCGPGCCEDGTVPHLDMTSRGVATGSTTGRSGPSDWRKLSAAMAGMLPSTLLKMVCSVSLDRASTDTTCVRAAYCSPTPALVRHLAEAIPPTRELYCPLMAG